VGSFPRHGPQESPQLPPAPQGAVGFKENAKRRLLTEEQRAVSEEPPVQHHKPERLLEVEVLNAQGEEGETHA
jgi:hypothetical protein